MTPSRQKGFWLWGVHSVCAALQNPQRICLKLLCTQDAVPKVKPFLNPQIPSRVVPRFEIDRLLPPGIVHQGMALFVHPLLGLEISDFLRDKGDIRRLVVLDQITDPRNFGAILRSAYAFGIEGVIHVERHSPPLEGVVAKSASGALEKLPLLSVSNLAQGIRLLKTCGFWCVGLSEKGQTRLPDLSLNGKIAWVFGAEGKGLRRLTTELCDVLVSLPTNPLFPTLNVSSAVAVTLYHSHVCAKDGLQEASLKDASKRG